MSERSENVGVRGQAGTVLVSFFRESGLSPSLHAIRLPKKVSHIETTLWWERLEAQGYCDLTTPATWGTSAIN